MLITPSLGHNSSPDRSQGFPCGDSMKFSMLFPVILAAVSAASEAQSAAQSAARPRIIVAISVDEFSADLFTEYRPLFKAGLHRLQSGVVFPGGYQSHAATETCPGHSTILTGSRPARTGIIANEWYDQSLSRADKKVYCSGTPHYQVPLQRILLFLRSSLRPGRWVIV